MIPWNILEHDAPAHRRFARHPRVIKEILQEWWYFEFIDVGKDIKFMVNYSMNNPLGIEGGFPRGCDIVSAVQHGNISRATSKDTSFMDCFTANDEHVVFGDGEFFIDFGADNTVHVAGLDTSTGTRYDLTFTRKFPPAMTRTVHVGNRFFDRMKYIPVMPSSTVSGSLWIDGKRHDIDRCVGYHDHFIGSPTQVRWAPWVTINTDDFTFISVTVPNRKDFSMACIDEENWIELGRPSFTPLKMGKDDATGFVYPTSFNVKGKTFKHRFLVELKEIGPHAMFDGGMDDYRCPMLWSWNYISSGSIDGFEFHEKPAAIYYWSNFDLVELARSAGMDVPFYGKKK